MERRLAAILAADVVGYTRLMGTDEAGTLSRFTNLRQQDLEPLIDEHHGRVFKLMGDGLLVEFASVVDALVCAAAWQKCVAAREATVDAGERLMFRIGVNLGDVIVEGDDIHGDGVNIAARLEGLAEPGGICLSDDAYRHAKGKLELTFEDLGEQDLKNVAEPTRVYRVAADRPVAAPTSAKTEILPLPDKPSIAVLPFDNLSGDPEQEYFSNGLTVDIISQLSRFRDLFVIASNSTFTYKGKPTKIQDVSHELGVRYILEGSVRKSGERVRVSVQLVDGQNGRQLWAERYDRQLDDIFKVQDEVTEMVVGTLASGYGGRLRKAWQERATGKKLESVLAFDYFMRGLDVLEGWTKDDNRRGRELIEKAIEINPNYAKAYGKLAWCHILDAAEDWGDDYDASLKKGQECATKGIEVEDNESWPHWALAGCYIYMMRHDLAQVEFERAVALNPNDADVLSDVGYYLAYAGKAEEGLDFAAKGMRLNPHYPEYYVMQLGQIYFDARQYENAVATFRSLPNLTTTLSCLYTAASHAALSQSSVAKEAIGRVLALDPTATLEKWTSARFAPYKNPKDLEHFRENLRKAGLPD